MTYRTISALVVLTCASFTFGQTELNGGDLSVLGYGTLGSPITMDDGPRAAGDPIAYSNVATFLGFITAQGPSENQAGNQITRLAADDITPVLGAGLSVSDFSFSVVNANQDGPVTFRPRVRFYANNAGTPGASIGGFTFNPITVPANTITLLNAAIGAGQFIMPATTFWAGVTFDNNVGGTGATAAQMDAIAQGFFNPPAVGSSADVFFLTTAAGSHLANNPPGALDDGGPNLVANLGWQFRVVPEPGTASLLGLLGLVGLKRRR